ncbi:sensor histidine kinase [Algoriphagus resistens]|uniref:sensor histidine kinase n=1 Tax=Algoriphagus resistens TaxID=1750590 RepID=UPI0018DF69AD|nr:histidine kinase [Algoriphagus resistens]
MRINEHPITELERDYTVMFIEHAIPFSFWRNVLFPQLASPLLFLLAYFLISFWVIPSFRKVSGDDVEKLFSKKILLALFSLLFVAFLLAIGINTLSFFARPHFFNYGGYQLLAIAGYNDNPLDNLFFGLGRTLAAVALVTILLGIRELLIWLIERKRVKREYWIMVSNNATPLLVIYICILFIINPLHHDFVRYQFFVLPVIGLYLYLTFWLFPLMEGKKVLSRPVFFRLLVSTFICVLPGLLLLFNTRLIIPIFYWISLLLVATPVFWLIYNQRKERILQLIKMETALASSDAKLQFLKSQINPHFLFNALNTLYGTALKGDSDQTAVGIQKLGDMMRFMLHENTLDRIPMHKELEYLNNFISLQKLRIISSSNISIEEEIDERYCTNQIPPMLLIPFVENAFKHGISLKEKSWIRIKLKCLQDQVNFEVRNSIHKNERDPEREKSGIGLRNVKERLALLYPNSYVLDIQETDQEFSIKLLLKC